MGSIGDFIKQRRLEMKLTQLDVAKRCGVSEGTVSRWESGFIDNMKRDKIAKLAKVLNISPLVLVGVPNIITFNIKEQQLIQAFRKLNNEGKLEASKRIEELTIIPRYKKNSVLDDIDISIDFKDKSQTIAASGLDENTPVTDHNEEVMQKALNRIKKKKEEEDRKELEMPL